MNKVEEVELVVATRMDLSFKGDLTVITAEGALEGPWTVEGTVVRTSGTGLCRCPVVAPGLKHRPEVSSRASRLPSLSRASATPNRPSRPN